MKMVSLRPFPSGEEGKWVVSPISISVSKAFASTDNYGIATAI